MNRKFVWTILLSLILISPGFSQVKINFTEYDLDNGLHVILHQDKSTPIVAITVLYHVGSKNEKPDRTGFAHFFEHLMFSGSKYIPRGDYYKMIQNAGGQLNANTTQDRTLYYEILPSNQLSLGLWMESERMLHLKIDSISVETQRKVVKEERKQRFDNQPYGSVFENIFKYAYKVYPYKWVPIGSVQYIDKATLPEFINFYHTYYVPQNATLSIAGDMNIEKTKELIKEYFGDIPKGTKKIYRPDVVEPPQTAEVVDTVYDNIRLPAVIEAYHIPAIGTKDFYPLDMLTTLLAVGKSSRLYKAVVDSEQKAVDVEAFSFGLEAPGLFISLGIANTGINASDLENSIDAQIEKVKMTLITDEELQKLKNLIESRAVSAVSTDAGIAENLAEYHVIYGNTDLINSNIQRYLDVTKQDIQRVANEYLKKENRVVLFYLPKALQNKEGK